MTVDVFTIRPDDTAAIGELVDLLAEHCDTEQVETFLADLTRWHRSEGRRPPTGHQADARRELEQWQHFIDSLTAVAP